MVTGDMKTTGKVSKPAVILLREEAQRAGKIIVGDENGCGMSPVPNPSIP